MDKPSVEDTFMSLNGFDEVAIEQFYRKPPGDLSASLTARALVFVVERRNGASDQDAYRTSMTLPLRDVNDYFSDGADGANPGIVGDLSEAPGKASEPVSSDANSGPDSSPLPVS